MPNVSLLREALFETSNGGVASPFWTKLCKLATAGNDEALQAIADYVACGPIAFVRGFLASTLVELTAPGSARHAEVFAKGLADPGARYWCIVGLLRSRGASAYPSLVKLALDPKVKREDRACAIKQLALHSGQLFDRQLPADPGFWSTKQFRVDEVRRWARAGFPRGPGHPPLVLDRALSVPRTVLEKLAARLDRKLAADRTIDPADPRGVLIRASSENLKNLQKAYQLPADYLEFLRRFSPVATFVSGKKFVNQLQLFGASELVEAQLGYSIHGKTGKPIQDWPLGYMVIASDGGDPYAINTLGAGEILTAVHGVGSWDFKPYAPSFTAFLRKIV